MKLIKTALTVLSKIRSIIVIRDNAQQRLIDKEVDAFMGHVRALYPQFMTAGSDVNVIRTTGAIELDHKNMSHYKQSFRDLGIALVNATPQMQAAGYNMYMRFGNNMLPVKVYKQVALGRGQRCRMMKPAI